MKTEKDALLELESILDKAIIGQMPQEPLNPDIYPEALRPFVKKLGRLLADLGESVSFASCMGRGEMDTTPPGRRNYLSAPLKELHSQLTSFCWSIEQLISGNMVSKLHYPGRLFEMYNALVEKVSLLLSSAAADSMEGIGNSVTSWRYHQILSAINQLQIMIIEVNADGEIVFANPPAKEMLSDMERLPYGQTVPENLPLLQYLCTFASTSCDINMRLAEDFPVLHEMYDKVRGAWYKITSDCVRLSDGNYGILHMVDDISEWKHHEQQLQRSANIDVLTSAYTRKAGFKKLEELIRARREQSNCVAFIDIDGLKDINDRYGHTEGDYAIRTIAETLIACVRRTDQVIRYGGDEFLILFMGADLPTAQHAIERMYHRMDNVNGNNGKPYQLGFSVGVAAVGSDIESSAQLIELVDERMYQDKLRRKSERKRPPG